MTTNTKNNLDIAKQAETHAKIEFLENMRHDIRTPLTGIIGFAELIQKEAVSKKIKSYANDLVSATTALLDFQNDILDAIKSSPEINPVSNTFFPLKKLVESVIDLIKPKAIIKRLNINLDYDNALPTFIFSDYKRLYRILLELITNALKFTERGQINIKIGAECHKQDPLTLILSVADSGIGIPTEHQQEVFIRFKRLSPSSDGLYEGTGLGLTTVRQFVEDLNGNIRVESERAKGATFICEIPITQLENNLLDNTLEANSQITIIDTLSPLEIKQLNNVHILLVEDHPLTAKVTQLLLSDMGCQVDIARNAQSAFLKTKRHRYDLLIVDIGLPDKNGFCLASDIRKSSDNQNHKTPIIALTAHIESEYQNREKRQLVDMIFQKPLLKSVAIDILKKLVLNIQSQLPSIDLALGAKRISQNEDAALDMLKLLQKTLYKEAAQFDAAFIKQDFAVLEKLTHRLSGALAYCGAPQLEMACQALKQSLKNDSVADIQKTYSDLQSAITTLNNELGA